MLSFSYFPALFFYTLRRSLDTPARQAAGARCPHKFSGGVYLHPIEVIHVQRGKGFDAINTKLRKARVMARRCEVLVGQLQAGTSCISGEEDVQAAHTSAHAVR